MDGSQSKYAPSRRGLSWPMLWPRTNHRSLHGCRERMVVSELTTWLAGRPDLRSRAGQPICCRYGARASSLFAIRHCRLAIESSRAFRNDD